LITGKASGAGNVALDNVLGHGTPEESIQVGLDDRHGISYQVKSAEAKV
jgi:hypothetical protein